VAGEEKEMREEQIPSSVDLSEIQLQAIELTARGMYDVRIAEELHVSAKTLYRWKTFNADYRKTLADVRAQNFAGITDRYPNVILRATAELVEQLSDKSANVRYRAAQTLGNAGGCYRPPMQKVQVRYEPFQFAEPELSPKVG
jgi:hypothetical protein